MAKEPIRTLTAAEFKAAADVLVGGVCPNWTFDAYPTGMYSEITENRCGVWVSIIGIGGKFGIQPMALPGGAFLKQALSTAREIPPGGVRPKIRVIFDTPVAGVTVIQTASLGFETEPSSMCTYRSVSDAVKGINGHCMGYGVTDPPGTRREHTDLIEGGAGGSQTNQIRVVDLIHGDFDDLSFLVK